MSPRVYRRSFDWDEAKLLHDQGISYAKLAAKYGVSETAVYWACHPGAYQQAKLRSVEYQRGGVCVDCGNSCTRNRVRCDTCQRAWKIATSPIATADTLQCQSCRGWKADGEFPFASSAARTRRGRHALCRACQTIMRRSYRDRNKVPCANGCGRLVLAINEQEASARHKGYVATGMCIACANKTKKQRAA